MQTLCTGCSKAEPNKFALPQIPFPGLQEGQNLKSWRGSLPSPTNPVWWGLMHAISSYHGNRPTNIHTQTHKQTHRQDRLQYTARLSAQRRITCRRVTYVIYDVLELGLAKILLSNGFVIFETTTSFHGETEQNDVRCGTEWLHDERFRGWQMRQWTAVTDFGRHAKYELYTSINVDSLSIKACNACLFNNFWDS